jgi:hypothetical protein
MYRTGRRGQRPGRGRPKDYYENSPRSRRGFISPQTKSFAYGLGVGILVSALFPQLKDGLKPAAAGTVKGVMNIAEKVQEMVSGVREGIEDIVAEARFENLKDSLEKEILGDAAVKDAAEEVVGDIIK